MMRQSTAVSIFALLAIGISGCTPDSCNLTILSSPYVLMEGDSYRMWFTDSLCEGGSSGIFHATSSDGIHWVEKAPVLLPSANGWDRDRVGSPSILLINKTYHMWFRGDGFGKQQIGHATSSDGIHWEKTPGPVLAVGLGKSWDSVSLVAPHVIWNDGMLHLWYRGSRSLDQIDSSVGLARSSDGIHWQKDPQNPIISLTSFVSVSGQIENERVNLISDPSALYDEQNQLYEVWLSCSTEEQNDRISKMAKRYWAGNGKMLVLGRSSDLISWNFTEIKPNPIRDSKPKLYPEHVITQVDNPFVIHENETYFMWLRQKTFARSTLAYTTSQDGINWGDFIDVEISQ